MHSCGIFFHKGETNVGRHEGVRLPTFLVCVSVCRFTSANLFQGKISLRDALKLMEAFNVRTCNIMQNHSQKIIIT